MKLIKINTDHYIIVDDSEIKEGDYVFLSDEIYYVTELNEDFIILDNQTMNSHIGVECERYKLINKITHSTQPLEDVSGYGEKSIDVPLYTIKGFDNIQQLSLSEIKELLGVVDVEKKARSQYSSDPNDYEEIYYLGLIKGYNQCLEDNKEKKWTDEDLRKAIEFGYQLRCNNRPINSGHNWVKDFIAQSLQPKTEWEVEFVNGKLKLL